jgi:hypothetical protein
MHAVTNADFILGVRMLMSAAHGHCGFRGGSNCRSTFVLGAVIMSASVLDLLIALAFVHLFHHMCTHLDKISRKVLHHRIMLCNTLSFYFI